MNLLMLIQDAVTQPTPEQNLLQAQTGFFGLGFVVIASLAATAVLGGLFLMTMVVAPDLTARCSGALRHRNLTSFATGGAILIAMLLAGAVCKALPILAIPWVIVATVLYLVGVTAASEDVGRRLFWACGRDGNRALHVISGWTVCALACCVPVVGWFVVAPYLVLSGAGSLIVGFFTGAPEAPGRRETPEIEIQ
jgi:hypothetical protein